MRRLLVLVAVAAAAALTPAAASAAGRHHHRHEAPSQAAVAQRLARAVLRAHTTAKRTAAVRNVMRAVHIPVVTPKGRAVVVAPELRAARAFQLYDFELRGLAQQLGRHEKVGLGALATLLAKAGLDNGAGKPLPAALLRDALVSAARKALRAPRKPASLLPLLVRALGRPGYDLARAPATGRIRLDTLQAELVAADIALPVLRRLQTGHGATAASATARTAGLSDVCQRFRDAEDKLEKQLQDQVDKSLDGAIQGWIAKEGAGQIFGQVVSQMESSAFRNVIFKVPRWAAKGVVKGIRAAQMANPIIAALHDILLSYSIDVSSPQSSLATHWNHHDGVTGKPLTFEVLVRMLDDYGDPAVKCGALAGFTLPPKGPVQGVRIVWTQDQTPLTPNLGTTPCGVICTSVTGADGIARMIFTPYSEIIPGIGPKYEDTGIVTGTALYQSAEDGGIAGQIAQFITPKQATTRWFVSYHKEPNLVLRITSTSSEHEDSDFDNGGQRGHDTMSGSWRVSSAGPLARAADTPGGYAWTTVGNQRLGYDAFSYSDTFTIDRTPPPDEVVTTTGTGVHPGVLSGRLLLARDVPAQDPDPGFTLSLRIGSGGYPAGQPEEDYHRHDSVAGDSDQTLQKWLTDFQEAMQPYYRGDPGGPLQFVVGGWRRGAGDVVAYKDVSYSNTNGATTTVHVHLELDAEPAP